jgi:hypothetical protein
VDPDEKAERRKELEDAEAFLSKARIEAPAVAGVGDPAEAIVDEAREEEPLAYSCRAPEPSRIDFRWTR